MNSRRIDQTMLLVGVVLILISSSQLFWTSKGLSDSEALGRISAKSAVVKSKGVRGLDWQDAHLGEPVSHNQLIYTDNRSSAKISLLTGTIIEVEENSLIRIQQESNLETLALEKGFVNTKLTGKPLRLKLGGQEVVLNSENALVQIFQNKEGGEIGVLSGEVALSEGNRIQKIDSSQMVLLNGQEMDVQKIAFDLVSPKRGEKIYLEDDQRLIRFEWTPKNEGELILEDMLGNRVSTSSDWARLAPGAYRWKVSSSSGSSLETPFSLVKVTGPEIIRPRDGERVRLAPGEGKKAELNFQWESAGLPVEMEWVQDEKSQLLKTEGSSLVTEVNSSGPLRWRVRFIYEDPNIKKWSEWQNLNVEILKAPIIPQPRSPDGAEFQFYSKNDWEIPLSWRGAELTEIEIRHPSGELKTLKSSSIEYIFSPDSDGDYEWRIRSLDEFGRVSAWTNWLRFSVRDLSDEKIAEAQRIQIDRPNQEVEFSWQGDETESVFEISKDPKFNKEVLLRKVKGSSASVNIPEPGVYYWRSQRFLPDGKIEVNEPRKVIIEPNAAPLKPKPLPDTEVPLQWKSVQNTIWDFFISSAHADSVEGIVRIDLPLHSNAKSYIVKILSEDGKVLLTRELASPLFQWENAVPGEYQWQYAIKDFWGRQSEFSDPSNLTIRPPALKRALLLSPIRAEVVSSENVQFKWKRPNGVKSFTFEVSQEEDFSKLVVQSDFDSKVDKEILPAQNFPGSGLYYWRVFSRYPDGRVKPSSVGRFKLLKEETAPSAPEAGPISFKQLLGILWTPSLDSYNFKDKSQEGEIDGQQILSTRLYAQSFKEKIFYAGSLQYGRGKVFDGEDYSAAQLKLSGGYVFNLNSIVLGTGLSLGYLRTNSYSIEGSKVRSNSLSSLQYGPTLQGLLPIDRSKTILFAGSYLLGEIQEIDVSSDLLYAWKRFYLQGGVHFKLRSFDVNDGEQSSLGVRLGIAKPF